jgi:putative acetyltransferase
MLKIRPFQSSDAKTLWQLKFQTVRDVNIKDYSLEQVSVWCPNEYDEGAWLARISEINPFVVEKNGVIAAYADLQTSGHIEHFYCGKAYIGQGVGGYLMQYLLRMAKQKSILILKSDVSITAKPFFEHFGFVVLKPQVVRLNNVEMKNYLMQRNSESYNESNK